MPYFLKRRPGGKFRLTNRATGRELSHHDQTKAQALAQLRAVKANTSEHFAKSLGERLRTVVAGLPPMMPGYGNVYLNEDLGKVYIEAGDSDDGDKIRAWMDAIRKVDGVREVDCECEYVPPEIREGVESDNGWVKMEST